MTQEQTRIFKPYTILGIQMNPKAYNLLCRVAREYNPDFKGTWTRELLERLNLRNLTERKGVGRTTVQHILDLYAGLGATPDHRTRIDPGADNIRDAGGSARLARILGSHFGVKSPSQLAGFDLSRLRHSPGSGVGTVVELLNLYRDLGIRPTCTMFDRSSLKAVLEPNTAVSRHMRELLSQNGVGSVTELETIDVRALAGQPQIQKNVILELIALLCQVGIDPAR